MQKKVFLPLWSLFFLLCVSNLSLRADNPAITMKTLNSPKVLFVLGSNAGGNIQVDFGDGTLRSYTIKANDSVSLLGNTDINQPIKVYAEKTLLNYIRCSGFRLTSINLSGCDSLKNIVLSHDSLPALDVSNQHGLVYLDCNDNMLTKLDISKNPHLKVLSAYSNTNMQAVDLSNNLKLLSIDLHGNENMGTIDVTKQTNLIELSVDLTGLSSLDVTKNTELRILNFSYNNISRIDLSKNTKLQQLYLAKAPNMAAVESLDVTNMPDLRYLFFTAQGLDKIDLSKNPKLQSLYCSKNNLDTLNLSNNKELLEIICYRNRLNFNTLPVAADFPKLGEYVFNPQADIDIKKVQIAVGGKLDISAQTYNEATATTYSVKLTNTKKPTEETTLEEGKDYKESNGVFTFLKPQKDSVYVSATNSHYAFLTLKTTKFMVLKPEDMNKPSLAFKFKTGKNIGNRISLTMTAFNHGDSVKVDFGNGVLKGFKLQTYIPQYGSSTEIVGNLAGDTVKVYTYPGVQIKDLKIQHNNVRDISFVNMYALHTLDLANNELASIDISQSSNLKSLVLHKNKLKTLDLKNNWFITNLSVADNLLETLDLKRHEALITVDVSNNKLKSLLLSECKNIITLTANNNLLSEIDLRSPLELTELYLNNNKFYKIDLSRNTNLNIVWLNDNYFRFSTLPKSSAKRIFYNVQHRIEIADRAPMIDIASEAKVDENKTEYVWFFKNGSKMVANLDYKVEDGITTFLDAQTDSVYCEMTNTSWPDLTLKTTMTLPSKAPETIVATLTSLDAVGKNFELSLAGDNAGYIYADYGNGKLTQLKLDTTYTIYKGNLGNNKTIKFYAYNDDPCHLRVLSVSNINLKDIDVSKLKEMTCLALYDANLMSIDVSHNTKLTQLILKGSRLSTIDLTNNKDIMLLNLTNNRFSSIDVKKLSKLSYLFLDGNKLKDIDLSSLPALSLLSIGSNELENINLKNSKNITDIFLTNNRLGNIDLTTQTKINSCHLDRNLFKLSTLPRVSINFFIYHPQADVVIPDGVGKVDLSSEYNIDGHFTKYTWLKQDSTILKEGNHYTIKDGVTVFLKQVNEKVYCVMQNDKFPKLQLKTNAISYTLTGTDETYGNNTDIIAYEGTITIKGAKGHTMNIYTVTGQIVKTDLIKDNVSSYDIPQGIYIVELSSTNGKSAKKVQVR